MKSSLIAISAEHLTNRMAVEVEGGDTMRKLRTVAASFAATGLAVLGVMAVPGAGANAATNQAITGCSAASAGRRASSGRFPRRPGVLPARIAPWVNTG